METHYIIKYVVKAQMVKAQMVIHQNVISQLVIVLEARMGHASRPMTGLVFDRELNTFFGYYAS